MLLKKNQKEMVGRKTYFVYIFAALLIFITNLSVEAGDSNVGSDLGKLVNNYTNEINSINQNDLLAKLDSLRSGANAEQLKAIDKISYIADIIGDGSKSGKCGWCNLGCISKIGSCPCEYHRGMLDGALSKLQNNLGVGLDAQTKDTLLSGRKGVPLRDQNDPANGIVGQAACGPTALGMGLEYLGKKISTPQIIKDIKDFDPDKGANISQLVNTAKQYLPNSHFSWGTAFGQDPMTYLKKQINSGGVVVVPVTGEYSAGRVADSAGHFLLVTGISDGNVYANDPNGGNKVVISEKKFPTVWTSGENSNRKPCVVIRK